VFTQALSSITPNFPSVTSVTSVRCLPIRVFSHGRPTGVHPSSFIHHSQFSLCDLRALCAMPSHSRVLARKANGCSPKLFYPSPPIPLCVLRDLCAMPFHSRVLAREANGVHPRSFIHRPQFPLCDLRDLCAMLFPFACSRTGSQRCSPKLFYPPPAIFPL
jgi:hypothetical protein